MVVAIVADRVDTAHQSIKKVTYGANKEVVADNAKFFRGHACTKACLLQPAISRISRQLRYETLPIFYGINKIHIDATAFSYVGSDPGTPADWWRVIGDTNLRMIKSLRLVRRNLNENIKRKRFDFTFSESKRRVRTVQRIPQDPGLADCVYQLEAGGLFVRGLERLLDVRAREAFGVKVADLDWPEETRQGEVAFESWGGGHYAFIP